MPSDAQAGGPGPAPPAVPPEAVTVPIRLIETWPRLLVKAIEWRLTGVLLGAVLGFLLTGSWAIGLLFGGLYNGIRMAVMPLRDRLWNRVAWGVAHRTVRSRTGRR